MSREGIFVFGASGHAKVVIDIIERQGLYEIEYLVDDSSALEGSRFFGYKVAGNRGALIEARSARQSLRGIVAIGANSARITVARWLAENGFGFVSVVHPSATAARGVKFGDGTVVMAGAVINSDAQIGRHSIVNTGATVDHDCIVGDGVHIAPGANLCGSVSVGDNAFLGAGSIVVPNLRIGKGAIVGAGATVLSDVPEGLVFAGTPARPIKGAK